MTTVRIDLRVPGPDGVDVPAVGSVEWRPTSRRHVEEGDEDYIVLPEKFFAPAQGDVEVAPTGAGWCWKVIERVEGSGGDARYVVVPDSASVVDYGDLVEVDPATLDPAAEPEAAWYVALSAVQDALEQVQAGQVPPEQIEAAVIAYLTENPVEGVTQQQLDDAIAAVELTPGPKGDKGDPGAPGAAGPANTLSIGTVTTGAAGSSASASITGTAPNQTLSLAIPRGATGSTGAPGANGQDGAPGADGADGASAYEVAVANGFVGTEASWLASLVGPAGADGQDGAEGPQGPAGEPGQDATGSGLLNEVVVHGDSLVTNDNPDFGGGTFFHEHLADELGVPVAGEGYGGADSKEIGGNAGAYRSDVTVDNNTIPASGSVTCTVTKPQYCKAEYGLATGWLGGVYGWWDGSQVGPANTTRVFVRAEPGDAVTVLPGTTWQPERAVGHNGKVAMMITGGNDFGGRATAAERVAAYKAVARRYGYRFLAVSSIHLNGHMIVGDENAETVTALDAEFGGLHLNLDAFMKSEEALTRAGVTPTTDDTAALAADPTEVPPSLLYTDGSHLNANGYRAFASKAAAILRGAGLIDADVTPPPADTTAPSTPTGLDDTAVTHTSVSLAWSPSTDDTGVTGYRVRRDGGTPTAWAPGTTRTISGLTASTEYDLEVQARDAAGNESGWSTVHTVSTTAAPADTTGPTQPGTVSVTGITQTEATLTWPASTDPSGVDHYRVTGVGAERNPTTATYTFTGLTADTLYSGTVVAVDTLGNESTGRAFSFTTEAEVVIPEGFPITDVAVNYSAEDPAMYLQNVGGGSRISRFINQGTATGVDLWHRNDLNGGGEVITAFGAKYVVQHTEMNTGSSGTVDVGIDVRSFAAVAYLTGVPGAFTRFARIRTVASTEAFEGYVGVDSTRWATRGNVGGEAVNTTPAGLAVNDPFVIVITYTGASGEPTFHINGVARDSVESGAGWTDVTALKDLNLETTLLRWAELFLDDRAWTSTEIADVTAYLMDKYGIV